MDAGDTILLPDGPAESAASHEEGAPALARPAVAQDERPPVWTTIDRIAEEFVSLNGRPMPIAVVMHGWGYRGGQAEARFGPYRIVVACDLDGESLVRDVPVPTGTPSKPPSDRASES